MNDVHIHLWVNHFPFFGFLFGLLLGLFGVIQNKPTLLKAAYITVMFSTLFTIAALRTGEPAEEVVEELGTVSHHQIHEHEELAEKALWPALICGGVAVCALLIPTLRKWLNPALAAAIVITLYILFLTAYEGGLIMRPHLKESISFLPSSIISCICV